MKRQLTLAARAYELATMPRVLLQQAWLVRNPRGPLICFGAELYLATKHALDFNRFPDYRHAVHGRRLLFVNRLAEHGARQCREAAKKVDLGEQLELFCRYLQWARQTPRPPLPEIDLLSLRAASRRLLSFLNDMQQPAAARTATLAPTPRA